MLNCNVDNRQTATTIHYDIDVCAIVKQITTILNY